MNKYFLVVLLSLFMQVAKVAAAPWQWSVEIKELISEETNAHPSAYLWIPENCKQVRAVIVGQHNMTEETIFEHPGFRKNMAKKEVTYAEAMAEIEKILARLRNEEMDVDSLAAEVKRATELIASCKARLRKAEADVNKILE